MKRQIKAIQIDLCDFDDNDVMWWEAFLADIGRERALPESTKVLPES